MIDELVAGTTPIATDAERATLSKLNAALTSFLFLLYFDTRAGYQDTGPYPLPDGRTLLVRDFNEMAVSHFPWSTAIGADLPHANLTVALVLDGVDVKVNDWGTTVTDPVDYLQHVVAAGFFDSTGGTLTPIPTTELDDLRASVEARAEGPLPADRGDEPGREDRRGRVRVLHVPPPVRRASPGSRTTSTGPCRATASISTRRSR